MSPAIETKPNFRMIAASFAAGIGAMALAGFVAHTALGGGLSLAEANASTFEAQAPVLEPLDVVALQAQLAEVERALSDSRAETDLMVDRLGALAAE